METRKCNVEIHAAPESRKEDTLGLVKAVTDKLQTAVDIKLAYRVGEAGRERPRKIVALLKSEEQRETLVAAARGRGGLTSGNIVNFLPATRIYMN